MVVSSGHLVMIFLVVAHYTAILIQDNILVVMLLECFDRLSQIATLPYQASQYQNTSFIFHKILFNPRKLRKVLFVYNLYSYPQRAHSIMSTVAPSVRLSVVTEAAPPPPSALPRSGR